MASENSSSKTISFEFNLGARISLVLGLAISAIATAIYMQPTYITGGSGDIPCGSAVKPLTDTFSKSACYDITTTTSVWGAAVAAVAVLIGIGGMLVFGLQVTNADADNAEAASAPNAGTNSATQVSEEAHKEAAEPRRSQAKTDASTKEPSSPPARVRRPSGQTNPDASRPARVRRPPSN